MYISVSRHPALACGKNGRSRPRRRFPGCRPVADARRLGRDVTYSKLNDIPPAVTGVYISSHLNPGDAAQVKAILVSIREHHELLTQMHAAFSAAEMVTYYDLRAR